jgi:hypothetical protein
MKCVAMSMIISVLAAQYGEASAMDVPKDLAGQYAPGGDCTREPRLVVDGQGITVQSGGKQSKLAPVDVCRTCVRGMRYEGIEVWIGPNAKDGDQPFVFRFNANEKVVCLRHSRSISHERMRRRQDHRSHRGQEV